jgi:molybdopterin-guanine dinucleotide biosynthesis protein A
MPFGIVILAGGQATRFPGKLLADADGIPMIARVVSNLRAASDEIVIASSRELAARLRETVDVPVLEDDERARGPVGGMLTAFAEMREATVFAAAGDAPFIDAAFVRRLYSHWRAGSDRALVPIHTTFDGQAQSEPLAAFYDRRAFLREAPAILRDGRGAVRLVVEALHARYVHVDDAPHTFTNVNTPDDYAAMRAHFTSRGERQRHDPRSQ